MEIPTCGYFPTHQRSGLRDQLEKERQQLSNQYQDLDAEMEVASMWDMLKLKKQRLDVRLELGKVERQLEEACVREPGKALLRLSRKRDVGLSKEGGVCCKAVKGLAVEYHIAWLDEPSQGGVVSSLGENDAATSNEEGADHKHDEDQHEANDQAADDADGKDEDKENELTESEAMEE
jgi:hypothetical protein